MTCKYCKPDKKGNRKDLFVERFNLNHSFPKIKRNILKIYRRRNGKRRYFIGIHSMDLSKDEKVMFRNNGFTMQKNINYCPMCGNKLIKE